MDNGENRTSDIESIIEKLIQEQGQNFKIINRTCMVFGKSCKKQIYKNMHIYIVENIVKNK